MADGLIDDEIHRQLSRRSSLDVFTKLVSWRISELALGNRQVQSSELVCPQLPAKGSSYLAVGTGTFASTFAARTPADSASVDELGRMPFRVSLSR